MSRIWTQTEEAERLKARFQGVKQAQFARDHNLPGGASMLSQHIHNRRPLNLEHALVYAKGFGVSLDEISPRLASETREASGSIASPNAVIRASEPPPRWKVSPGPSLEASLLVLGAALQGATDVARMELRQRFAEFVDAPDSRIAIRRICQLLGEGESPSEKQADKAQTLGPQSTQTTGRGEPPKRGNRRLVA